VESLEGGTVDLLELSSHFEMNGSNFGAVSFVPGLGLGLRYYSVFLFFEQDLYLFLYIHSEIKDIDRQK